MTAQNSMKQPLAQYSYLQWIVIGTCLAVMTLVYWDGLTVLVAAWEREEYSHGYILPFVALFFVWQKSDELARVPFKSTWSGLLVVLVGLTIYLMGELSTLYILIQYSFLITLAGLLITLMGWQGFRIIFIPYALLFFTIPLPGFLYNNLSSSLQLISSELGVAVIRMFGITVFLEGNVIDLGEYKLQVVEACSGLRYLFPLTALGFIAAYIYKGAIWKKVIIFLSTIPITVLMNSFRIGVIGVMVEHWGESMAEGFLHDFEGWVIFMACAAVLLFEMWILSKLGKDRKPLKEAFALEFPESVKKGTEVGQRSFYPPFYAAFLFILAMALVSQILPQREEFIPERLAFDSFPEEIGEWKGKKDRLETMYLDVLKLTDYLVADYYREGSAPVNFYIAYYESQRKGASAHSPRSCLPGGGWKMTQFEQQQIDGVNVAGTPLRVNRVVIQMGDVKQLVYYWFQQRGRVVTNEYLVKWYLFWDALTRNRTDGSLVRLVSSVGPGQNIEEVDRTLEQFAREISGKLAEYLPD